MKYWVFYDAMLSSALAQHEAERQKEGASEQQAKDETAIILRVPRASRAHQRRRPVRDALVLTPPIAPKPLRGRYVAGDAEQAVRDAMNAALRGDFAALDRLELSYLNVLVRIGELFVKDANGTPHWWFDLADARCKRAIDDGRAPFVVAYHRSFGGRGEPALEWQLMPVCRRCEGKLRRLECRICAGAWYLGESSDDGLVTTSEGVILFEGERAEALERSFECGSDADEPFEPDWEGA